MQAKFFSAQNLGARFKLEPHFASAFPGDFGHPQQPRQTPGVLWSQAQPTPVAKPKLVGWSEAVAQAVGILRSDNNEISLTEWLAGNCNLEQSQVFATCYGGHQFGHWAGQLGDGRAIHIAEINHQSQHFELQLKGAGLTPYSRTADGRAVLRSSIREFLCSEAMHYLGVPTTRALSLVSTGDSVVRDILYSGHPAPEPGAIVCRVAPSFLRFGHFEILAARGETLLLNRLIEFVIRQFNADLLPEDHSISAQTLAAWFSRVCEQSAELVCHWQRVGFVHGVLNTDNMSILGLTIDYGPYGWLDNYDPDWTPNTTDAQGKRYRFANQPLIVRWNLIALANALATVIDDLETLKQGINHFDQVLKLKMNHMQLQKFALGEAKHYSPTTLEGINQNIESIYSLLHQHEMDFSLSFSALRNYFLSTDLQSEKDHYFSHCFYQEGQRATPPELMQSLSLLKQIRQKNLSETQIQSANQAQALSNPQFVLRNYLSQQAIEKAEKGDYAEFDNLYRVLQQPFDVADQDKHYQAKRPEWAKHKAGCSMLSCSS